MASNKLYTVFEVMYHSDEPGQAYAGAFGDGSFISRFKRKSDAEKFASDKLCYGKPAKVIEDQVSRRLAQRWGVV